MRAKMKPIIPKKLRWSAETFKRAIEDALDEAADLVLQDFEDTVKTWDTPVKFIVYSRSYEREVTTNNMIYSFVNDGTKKHKIAPKKAKALAFASLTGPKTMPYFIGSGEGFRGGVTVFAKHVMHPGTKPRYFNKAIRDRWLKFLPALIQEYLDKSL